MPSAAARSSPSLTVAAFYVFTVVNVLGYVLGPGPVTGDKLHAAVAACILTALLWTALYALVDHLVPGSFSVRGTSDLAAPLSWKNLLFFSFTTLTSTGYGGIIPAADHAQSLAILEQLAGVFYVAILIARLAGLYQPGASRRSTWHTSGTDGVPGPSVRDAPSAGFFAWRPDWRTMTREIRRAATSGIAGERGAPVPALCAAHLRSLNGRGISPCHIQRPSAAVGAGRSQHCR
jgi:hypothetical protein